MFHISNDKRTKVSANKILNGLISCLTHAPLERISVTDICSRSGVSRTTFYRLFDNPTDIIHWAADCWSEKLVTDLNKSKQKRNTLPLLFCLQYVFEHSEALEVAIAANRIDIADKSFAYHISKFMEESCSADNIDPKELEYNNTIMSSIIVATYCHWKKGGKTESINEMHEHIQQFFKQIEDLPL